MTQEERNLWSDPHIQEMLHEMRTGSDYAWVRKMSAEYEKKRRAAECREMDMLLTPRWYNKINWGIAYWLIVFAGLTLAFALDFWPGIPTPRESVLWKILRYIAPFWSYRDLMKISTLTEGERTAFGIIFFIYLGSMLVAVFRYVIGGSYFMMKAKANSFIRSLAGVITFCSAVTNVIAAVIIAFALESFKETTMNKQKW